ncbi:MAG: T9SS type A sorting domain-containing protein, partial [Lewinella sp.]|nr:T9SS type A sorting domain-containing protein [Lewinella sp.]
IEPFSGLCLEGEAMWQIGDMYSFTFDPTVYEDEALTTAIGTFDEETTTLSLDVLPQDGATVYLSVTDDDNACSRPVDVPIDLVDEEAPTAVCQEATVLLDAAGDGTLALEDVNDGSSDNCDIADMTLSNTDFDCGDIGATVVTLTVTDTHGLTGDCTATVTVTEMTDPVFPGLADHFLTTEGGASCPGTPIISLVEDKVNPVATGNEAFTFSVHGLTFDGPTVYSDNCSSGEDLKLYVWKIIEDLNDDADAYQRTIRVRWRVIDASGNQRTRKQDFTITDDTDPVLVCRPEAVAVFNGEDPFELETILGDLVDLDNTYDACGGDDLSFTLEPAFLSCEQLGETVDVTVTVCDGADPANCTDCVVPVYVDGLPCGWMTTDAHIDCPGSEAEYDVEEETFLVTAADCSHTPYSPNSEEYAYVNTTLCGDGELIAQVTSLDGLGKAWAGIVMRESNDPTSKKFQLMTGLDYLQHRVDWRNGGVNQSQTFSRFGQHWLRIVRTGPVFQAYTSIDGANWGIPVSTQVIPMAECIEVGLVVTNVPFATNVSATFQHVQLTPPYVPSYPEDLRPETPATGMTGAWQLTVFPNPTSGQLTVNLSAFLGQDVTLEVTDLNGQLLLQRPLGQVEQRTEPLDLSVYPAGVYLLRLRTTTGRTAVQRVILQPRP